MKKPSLSWLVILFFISVWHNKNFAISSLAKNDPYPLFSTSYPYNYLLQSTKNYLKGIDCDYYPKHLYVAFTGFYQKANCGSNYDRVKNLPLGDLEGRWHMLGMTYGPSPSPDFSSIVFPGSLGTIANPNALGRAKVQIFGPVLQPVANDPNSFVPPDNILTDSTRRIGFYTAPIKYRKHGVRFQVAFQPHEDFGILAEGSYADIRQTLTQLIDLTPSVTEAMEYAPQFSAQTLELIQELLMTGSSANCIFRQQGLTKRSNFVNNCDFREGSFEDIRFKVWLRHIFCVNEYTTCEWPEFLFIPFFNLEGSVSAAKKRDRMDFLSLPFGNDGHSSIAFTAGFHIDFTDTVEIGFHGGATYFLPRDVINYRLPNHKTQSGIFPFATDVRLHPGNNHHFAVMLHAYRFLGKLSAHAEFLFVNHDEDSITLKYPSLNNFFDVRQQECYSKFTAMFLNTAVNYELSPNLRLGFEVQWPLQQRNSYRSTTLLGSIVGVF